MIKRLKTGTAVVAGLAALALGGSAIAGAASGTAKKSDRPHESTTAPDTDNIQSGDQTTPDAATTKSAKAAADGDNVQSGDQTTPDTGTTKAELSTSETSSETSGESTVSDGPGGYADPAGTSATTEQQGQH